MRYIRAFFTALTLTLKGEIPEPDPLQVWMEQGRVHLKKVTTASNAHSLDPSAVIVRIDRRDISMKTILDAVQFHLTDEYPQVLQHFGMEGINVIYASNLDDHYRLVRLADTPELQDTPVQQAVNALSDHLEAVPRVDN